MKSKLALAAFCVALVSGCAGTPQWDTAAFPHQPIYDGTTSPPQQAAAK